MPVNSDGVKSLIFVPQAENSHRTTFPPTFFLYAEVPGVVSWVPTLVPRQSRGPNEVSAYVSTCLWSTGAYEYKPSA